MAFVSTKSVDLERTEVDLKKVNIKLELSYKTCDVRIRRGKEDRSSARSSKKCTVHLDNVNIYSS